MVTKTASVIITSLLLFTFFAFAGEKPDSSIKQSADGGVGASGAVGSTAGASGSGARISGGFAKRGDQLGMSANSPVTEAKALQRHPLSCPQAFDKDGVYIWCDPDGVWTIFWCGKKSFELVTRISSQSPISVKSSGGRDTEIIPLSDGHLEINGRCGPQPGIVQFSSASPEMEFEVLVDQEPVADRVYLGAQANSTFASSFVLQTRRDAVAVLPRGRNRPTAPTASETGVNLQAEITGKAPSLSSGQHGGGERNSSPRGKDNQGGE